MDGTGTYAVQFRDVFIPDDQVLAAPAMPFVKKIRAGFILMQMGMGLGLVRDCVAIMQSVQAVARPCELLPAAAARGFCRRCSPNMEAETMMLAATPFETSNAYWRARRRTAPARRRCRGRRGACGDAALWRARLSQIPPRAAAAARSLLRGDRHPRHQAAPKNARRQCARTSGRPERPYDVILGLARRHDRYQRLNNDVNPVEACNG